VIYTTRGLRKQPFHDRHAAPDAVQLAVFLAGANHPETERPALPDAGLVLDEDAREQFPEAGLGGCVDRRFERQPPGAPALRRRAARSTYTENSATPA
jgi:hypothetical protein